MPDGCDACDGHDDTFDTDGDGVPNGCDLCHGYDDSEDGNSNGVPDDCERIEQIVIDNKQVDGNYWRGWYVIDGSTAHVSTNDNTITGSYRSGSNSYFVFDLSDLSGLSGIILSVTLELEHEYYSGDATETFSVWDVSTDSATLEADGYSEPIYYDLMTGNLYHPGTVLSSATLGTVLSVELNEQAVADVQAALGGDFAVGVHSESEPGTFRFSNGSEVRNNRLIIDYLPTQQTIIDNKQVDGNYWRGWYVIDGSTAHVSTNDNTITGSYRSGSNSYFVFDLSDLSGLSGIILSVTLELEHEYYSGDATETFSVWDVSTDSATLEADGYSEPIYYDLMTGNLYHPGTVLSSATLGTVLSVELNEQAVTDVQASVGGDFSVGVHSESEPGTFRFSNGSEVRNNRLIVVHTP